MSTLHLQGSFVITDSLPNGGRVISPSPFVVKGVQSLSLGQMSPPAKIHFLGFISNNDLEVEFPRAYNKASKRVFLLAFASSKRHFYRQNGKEIELILYVLLRLVEIKL